MSKKIEFVRASVSELDPSKKYLIIFDNRLITKEDANLVSYILKDEFGIENVGVSIHGDPNESVKIIEND